MSAPEPRELTPRPDPPPGLPRLRRRLADRYDFRDGLLAGIAGVTGPGGAGPLGARLDVAGDPAVVTAAELWSRVADSVAAYTELTAGERYLGTAQDWTDLRRTIDLLGHRPTQRAAARGWIRCTTDTGASPLVPAGTRVQAPGTPTRAAQTFEVVTDTQLRADWADLTVTAVPAPQPPPGRALRLLTDPGFGAGDRVALVAEKPSGYVPMPSTWWGWLGWMSIVYTLFASNLTLRAVVTVTKKSDDLGAFLVTTDRELAGLLAPASGTTYAAYRVRAKLSLAHRLSKLSYVNSSGAAATAAVSYPGEAAAVGSGHLLVTDASAASPGMNILVSNAYGAFVTTVKSVSGVDWSVAPGTKHHVGRIELTDPLPPAQRDDDIEILLVDHRVVAQHHELPPLAPGGTRLRVHPRPAEAPTRIAVQTTTGWELADCSRDAGDTTDDVGGMLLVLGSGLTGTAAKAPATANLVPVRHGETRRGPLTVADGGTVVPGPVTADVDQSGRVTDSLTLRVGGVAFDEVDSLYGRDPTAPVFTTRLAADGRLVVRFGAEAVRGEVTATWRIGGGLVGELDATQIDTLLGSVRGVRKIAGVGRTTGAADQEDSLRMRRAAAARVRALDRAVSLDDLADLALGVPGTSHSVAWRGAGPVGCPCGGSGPHVASLRFGDTGVRAPLPAELASLAGYLDARRDTSVGLCVCAGVPSALTATLTVTADPRRDPVTVREAVGAALLDPAGPLAPRPRDLGVPVDASDVLAVAQAVTGVVGVVALSVSSGVRAPSAAEAAIGRTPAERYELLSVTAVTVQ
ncbi:hypothetical protein [Micromonospora thermarum]|uniref:Baseplate protein J-like domain-containing protein n=1 Tax=Micromonospora thermarum TaxID=2720024 RepID=A0ABX0Z357_9ACTN|nr:hypothetical protein [Micromonospora thermarum]NJP31903.1 hypothetical protein [Micromonospora thermarum]